MIFRAGDLKAVSSTSRRWSNQANWNGNNLMIPYEIDSGFSTNDRNRIISAMDGMTEQMNGCITYYHDTNQEYTDGGIIFKNDDRGCW